jgi:Helix-turn-helix domain
MRGRFPSGPEVATQLEGSRHARDRLRVILELIAGKLRVGEACEQLAIGSTRLDQLRRRALRAALDALEPRPGGRPQHRPEAESGRLAELETRVAELELTRSRAREELAGVQPPPGKKTKRRRQSRRR